MGRCEPCGPPVDGGAFRIGHTGRRFSADKENGVGTIGSASVRREFFKSQNQVWDSESLSPEAEYGTKCNKSIWVMRELTNSAANHFGLPLPRGRVRVYRRNADGQMEFTGENTIKHTPRDEVVRLSVGNSFDLVGERKRTDFRINLSGGVSAAVVDPTTGLPISSSTSTGPGVSRVTVDPTTGLPVPAPSTAAVDSAPWIDESFLITLRNHKKEAVEVRVVEHFYRWVTWEIKAKSQDFTKTDSQTIEFRLRLKPDEEKTVSYSVHYSW